MPASVRNKPSVPAVEEIDESTGADNQSSLQKFDNAKRYINTLTTNWKDVDTSIRNQRLMRRLRVDTEAARKDNKMQEGDIFIGVRTIDNNITLSLPPHVAYIKQSPRQAVFVANGQKIADDLLKELEAEFTRVMRYPKWEFDYIRLFDAAEFLGWGWVEVLYDRKKEGMCSVNHVGTEDLIFDTSVSDIQESRIVLRRYQPTLVTFLELAEKNGFDKRAVKQIKEKLKDTSNQPSNGIDESATDVNGNCPVLYKVMFKEGGKVFSSWYTTSFSEGWLREPRLFWNGIKEQSVVLQSDPVTGIQTPIQNWVRTPETEYPYYPMMKKITEDDELIETQGRGEMDQHIQQAQCTVWSGYVTQVDASTRQIWAPKTPDMSRVGGVAPKQSTIKTVNNALWDQPMDNFTPSPPDSTVPQALDKLATQNADNLNQPAWTVNNRQQDSRKTATEIQSAQQAESKITSTQVVISSVCIAAIQNAAWRIVQSQALQGNIVFLSSDGSPQGNALDLIKGKYTLRPAGDSDFIERQETELKMQQDWPLVSATPIAIPFMQEYLRLRYPTRAEGWIRQMQTQTPEKQALAALVPIVEELMVDDNGQPEPEVAPMMEQLSQIINNAKQLISASPTMASGLPAPNSNGSSTTPAPQSMAARTGNTKNPNEAPNPV